MDKKNYFFVETFNVSKCRKNEEEEVSPQSWLSIFRTFSSSSKAHRKQQIRMKCGNGCANDHLQFLFAHSFPGV